MCRLLFRKLNHLQISVTKFEDDHAAYKDAKGSVVVALHNRDVIPWNFLSARKLLRANFCL
jgi:hypothetical protein